MEITIKRYSRKLTYEDAATLDEMRGLTRTEVLMLSPDACQ